jgi:hypothetical protein
VLEYGDEVRRRGNTTLVGCRKLRNELLCMRQEPKDQLKSKRKLYSKAVLLIITVFEEDEMDDFARKSLGSSGEEPAGSMAAGVFKYKVAKPVESHSSPLFSLHSRYATHSAAEAQHAKAKANECQAVCPLAYFLL